MVTVKKSHKRS